MRITDKAFFTVSALELAEKLPGKIFVRNTEDGRIIRLRITETEAYGGTDDSASHASRGITKRNAPMFDEGGILYVYLCYGIFELLNIVSGKRGEPGGVLIRGAEGVDGPGRVSRALEISRSLNRQDLTASQTIWLEDDGFAAAPEAIQKLTRIGIQYAREEDRKKLWRFKLLITPDSKKKEF